ncbi:MAG: sulfur carrier protein ThiS [Rudaea sp.]|uniref:sulfur carrier protein ThiS n=1 Tax=unclassified Rudaea TaxID=2627037 RepID=UPI0010F8E3D8|nr:MULTISPECIES: sulfur carrier protein ThiS [unclassified Rudaea]MBN8886559.1 sulfur carrier protein ThiS [Rudaea sp.]MBR0344041.1 sulfur carrier protein ThiS [Rudaea sp.]
MLTIQLNGETRETPSGTSVANLLEASGYADRKVAVEINREIVPKSLHGERVLREGDRVEIVHALGGG